MADPTTDTFSVELLGFSPHVSEQDAALALAKVFGMDPARAIQLVKGTPVRVKGNAAPDVARRLATALLGIEANVRVKNDRTGAAREYLAKVVADDGPPSALREPPDAPPHTVRPPAISYLPGALGAYVPPGAPDPRAAFAAHAGGAAVPRHTPMPAPPATGAGGASANAPAAAGRLGTPLIAGAAASARLGSPLLSGGAAGGRLGSPLLAGPPPPMKAAQPASTPSPTSAPAVSAAAPTSGKASAARSPASRTNAAVEGETFTLTLLGFSPSVTDLDAAQAVSRVFGMDVQRAAALVRQVPVRVKGKAPADVARRLATALLGIDANLKITSDLTGEEREYVASGVAADGPPSALREVSDAPGRPPAISYLPGQLGAYVPPGAEDPRAVFTAAAAATAATAAEHAPPAPRTPASNRAPSTGRAGPGSGRPPPGVGPDATRLPSGLRPLPPLRPDVAARLASGDPPPPLVHGDVPAWSLEDLAGALPAGASPAPGAAPVSAPAAAPAVARGPAVVAPGATVCSSCHRQHPADASYCPHCGYSRKTHKHQCPACGGALVTGHEVGAVHYAIAGVLALGAIAATWFLGLATGAGFALAPFAAVAFGRAHTVGVRCAKCGKKRDAETLPAAAKKDVAQTRTVQLVFAALLSVLAFGPVVLYLGQPELVHESAQAGRFVASVPRTHRRIEHQPIDVSTGFAVAFGQVHEAMNPHFAIEMYRMVYVEIPNARHGGTEAENLSGTLTGVLADIDAIADAPKTLEGVDKVLSGGLEATFTAPGGLRGRVRTYHAGAGYLSILFVGRGEGALLRPEGAAFLASLHR